MDRGEFRTLNAEIATWSLLGIMYPYFYPTSNAASLPIENIREVLSIYLNGVTK
jgi:hypothetical protein